MMAIQLTSTPAPEPSIDLSQKGQVDRQTILQQLNQAFTFPDYFGYNWDAAYDLLMDEIDRAPVSLVWHFSLPSRATLESADVQTLQRLLSDLVAYAEQRQKRLSIWIHLPS